MELMTEMNIINASGYTLDVLAQVIPKTRIARYCRFLNFQNDIPKLCAHFMSLLKLNVEDQEFAGIVLGACVLFLHSNKLLHYNRREDLLVNAITSLNTLHPMSIHIVSECLWDNLKTPTSESSINLLALATQLAQINIVGSVISSCLMWALVADVCGRSNMITMHRFREFSDLSEMLQNIQMKSILKMDNQDYIFILSKGICNLITNIAFADKEIMLNAGYPKNLMNINVRDAKYIFLWIRKFIEKINNLDTSKKPFPQRNHILDNLKQFVLNPLHNFLEQNAEPIIVDNEEQKFDEDDE